MPRAEGHALVIPKTAARAGCSTSIRKRLAQLIKRVQHVAKAVEDGVSAPTA